MHKHRHTHTHTHTLAMSITTLIYNIPFLQNNGTNEETLNSSKHHLKHMEFYSNTMK